MSRDYAEIPVGQGLVTLVDVADLSLISGGWRAEKRSRAYYAVRQVRRMTGRSGSEYLHRVLLGLTDTSIDVDHINGNGLDNRRVNLRLATRSQNNGNARLRSSNRSGYKGVSWKADSHRWRARINLGGRELRLGYFSDPKQAALAYDEAAREAFGEYACLNFPKPGERSVHQRGEIVA